MEFRVIHSFVQYKLYLAQVEKLGILKIAKIYIAFIWKDTHTMLDSNKGRKK